MYCVHWRRSGMTLIEVLAGIVLLSTLLAMVVISAGRFSASIRRSDRRLEAARLLDDQLARWYAESGRLPLDGEGSLAGGEEAFRWRVTRLTGGIEGLPVRRVLVEVLATKSGDVLVALELLEPIPPARVAAVGQEMGRWSVSD